MKRTYQVVVVGGGIIGAAAFYQLSQVYGSDVLLIDQASPGAGASAVSGGLLRAFHLDPALTDDALEGLRFFRELAQLPDAGFTIERSGFVTLIGAGQLGAARAQFDRLAGTAGMQWLDGAETAALLDCPAGTTAASVYEADAGYVDVAALVKLLLRLGTGHGGCVLDGVAMERIASGNGVVRGIETSRGPIACATLVLCTGAWTPQLAARLGVDLAQPLRTKVIQIDYVQPAAEHAAVPATLPAFVDLDSEVYGRPAVPAMLVGCPVDCWDLDPDLVEAPQADQYREVVRRGSPRFAWLADASVVRGSRRQDAYTASGQGQVAWSPTLGGLLIATGYSGGGVKLAPVAAAQVLAHVRAARMESRRYG